MDVDRIRTLIALAEEHGLVELEVRAGDEAIRFVRARQAGPAAAAPAPAQADAVPGGEPVRAPMAGTFYAGAHPGAEPFVRVGDRVAVGDILAIIESMKMMNELCADRAGIVVDVAVADGQPVATGDLLFRLA